jgi:hypothetical protein
MELRAVKVLAIAPTIEKEKALGGQIMETKELPKKDVEEAIF